MSLNNCRNLYCKCLILTLGILIIGCTNEGTEDNLADAIFTDMAFDKSGQMLMVGTYANRDHSQVKSLVKYDSRRDTLLKSTEYGSVFNPKIHFNSLGHELLAYYTPMDTAKPSERLVLKHYVEDSLIYDKKFGYRARLIDFLPGLYETSFILSYYRGMHQGEFAKHRNNYISFRKEVKSEGNNLLPQCMTYDNDTIYIGGQIGTPHSYDGHVYNERFFGSFLSQYDAAGNQLWYTQIEPEADIIISDVSVQDNLLYAFYTIISDSTDSADIRVSRYTKAGKFIDKIDISEPQNQSAGRIIHFPRLSTILYNTDESGVQTLSTAVIDRSDLSIKKKIKMDYGVDEVHDVEMLADTAFVLTVARDTFGIDVASNLIKIHVDGEHIRHSKIHTRALVSSSGH